MRDPRRQLRSAPIAILALLGVLACNGEADVPAPGQPAPGESAPGESAPGELPAQDPTPGEPTPGTASVTVLTSTAAPGSAVMVQAQGFTPSTAVEIGFGQPRSEYSVVDEGQTDADGGLETSVEVPDWANPGQPYVIVVTSPDQDPQETSDPFVVGSPGDAVSVHGGLTDEGVECPALRGPFGTLYTLAVSDMEHSPGTEVMVEGAIAGASICMQGTTIDVESIEPR